MNKSTRRDYVLRHEDILHDLIREADIPAPRLREAITYTLFPGGKRLRPVLVYLCGQLMNVPLASLDMIAAAIELTHCYSLVHDDLPPMDNDDLRRGKPSCHRAFDEATAILVGDGLQALAIDILLSHLPKTLSMTNVVAITHELVKASGPGGMVSGQSLDLSELSNPDLDESLLQDIHQLKTGKLILACINMVLAAGNPSSQEAIALRQFATHFGLAFQMQDDYLDSYGEINCLGKGRASDIANQKTTFATLYSQQDLFNLITYHFLQMQETLTVFAERADELRDFIETIHQRIQ